MRNSCAFRDSYRTIETESRKKELEESTQALKGIEQLIGCDECKIWR